MRVSCPTCKTAYNIDETKIPAGGAKLKCSKCQNTFPIGTDAASAVPLPGKAGGGPQAVPLPGKAGGGPQAVPLPGRAGAGPQAVPLPGAVGGAPVRQTMNAAAVPLPGGRPAGGAVPLPGGRGGAVPLPGGRSMNAAVPLPASAPDDLEADLGGDSTGPVPLPGGQGEATDDFGFDPPAPSDATNFSATPDFPAAPQRQNTPGEFDLPNDGGGEQDSFALDFGAPPAAAPPAAAAEAPDPFSADLDAFGTPAPAPARAPSSPGDDLEFDPTFSPAPKAAASAAGGDDLEADLSAPVAPAPAPAPAGDDLELLDFIDDAAAQAKAKPRRGAAASGKSADAGFQVRKKSGQVLGPMPENEVTKLLSDGRLQGNEDLSQDGGATWSPLGSHPIFAEALQKLMEAPSALPGATSTSDEVFGRSNKDVNEHFKQIYGGRMAGINIVDSQESYAKIKKKLPQIIAGAIVALLLTIGFAQGLTPRGIFWRKVIFKTVIKPGDPLFQRLVAGRADLADGSYGALIRAQAAADAVLKESFDSGQARSLYVLAVEELHTRYQAAAPQDLKTAAEAAAAMADVSKTDPDTVAANAAQSLIDNKPELMRKEMQQAAKKNAELAPELTLLLAESYVATKSTDQAKAAFVEAVGMGTTHRKALTLHADYLASSLHDHAGAAALLQKALAEKPDYGPAAIALATLDVGPLAVPEKALEVLQPIAKGTDLSEEEKGRSHALTGMVLLFQKKPADAELEFKKAQQLAPHSPAVEGAYASYMIKRRDFDAAVPLFQNAYAQQPTDLDVIDGLVTALVGKGNLVDANKVALEADGRLPNNPRVAYLKGLVSDGADKSDEAVKNYMAAIQGDPKFTQASLALARFDLRHTRVTEASQLLADALKKEPDNPDLNAAAGEVALAQGKTDDALADFDKAIKLDADLAAAHLGRAAVLYAKGAFADAHTEADLAIKQDEHLAGNYRTLGKIQQAEKDYDKAKASLTIANKQDPKDEQALLHMGEVAYLMNDFDGAQVALENARTVDKTNPETHYYLALTHSKKTEKTQAVEEMTKAMEYGGQTNPEYHYQFGLIYKNTDGRFTDAVEEFKLALKLKPDYLDALEAYADALQENNDFAGAVANYEKIYAVDPKRSSMLGKEGDAYQKKSDFPSAVLAYKRHLAADPTALGDWSKMGKSYDDMGNKKEAANAFKKAVEAEPNNAEAWKALGYDLKGVESINAFNKYLKLTPNAPDQQDIQDIIDNAKADMHMK